MLRQFLRFLPLPIRTNRRRSFTIVVGLTEGYGTHITHNPQEVIDTALAWMKARAEANEPFLTGIFTPGTLAYAWKDKKGESFATSEPAMVFSGEVSVVYWPFIADKYVEGMLHKLAEYLGNATNQTRIYLTYRDKSWPLQAEGKESPRVPSAA